MKFKELYSIRTDTYDFEHVLKSQMTSRSDGAVEGVADRVDVLENMIVYLARKLSDEDKLELLKVNFCDYKLEE